MKSPGLPAAALLVASVLSLRAQGAERVGAPKGWALSFRGFGPVHIGMTVVQAEQALKAKLQEDKTDEADAAACHYASSDSILPGVAFMVEGRKIVRVDINSGAYRTSGGVHIGMTEQEVRKRHPNIKTEEHHYDPSGHYLTIVGQDQRYGIVFETDGKVVTNFRGGERGPVAYVEGCL